MTIEIPLSRRARIEDTDCNRIEIEVDNGCCGYIEYIAIEKKGRIEDTFERTDSLSLDSNIRASEALRWQRGLQHDAETIVFLFLPILLLIAFGVFIWGIVSIV